MGATACVFPSDGVTRDWMGLNGRGDEWVPLAAEDGARYDEVTEIDLGGLVPLVACPSNPDNVKTAEELADVPVHQVVIGSSTNGDYRDLMIASLAVAGQMRHAEVSFEINPGSRQTLRAVTEMGGLAPLVEAGARIHEAGCLGCIGMGQAPGHGHQLPADLPPQLQGPQRHRRRRDLPVLARDGRGLGPARPHHRSPHPREESRRAVAEALRVEAGVVRAAARRWRGRRDPPGPEHPAVPDVRAARGRSRPRGAPRGRRQHQHRPHHARGQPGAPLPQQHPRHQRLRLRPGRPVRSRSARRSAAAA